MTGFVFTFSLLCTAALQADPAILQRPETGILRPFLEAALPAVRLNAARSHSDFCAPVAAVRGQDASPDVRMPRGTAIIPEYPPALHPTRRQRPIRAPTFP